MRYMKRSTNVVVLLCLMLVTGTAISIRHVAAADKQGKVLAIHGKFTIQRLPGETQTGEITGAGLLNSTFVLLEEEVITRYDSARFVKHVDKYFSKTHTHVDPTGARVPDTFIATNFITAITEGGLARFAFVGEISEGTGIFEGATGYVTGFGTQVESLTAFFAEGTQGGEIRFAGRH